MMAQPADIEMLLDEHHRSAAVARRDRGRSARWRRRRSPRHRPRGPKRCRLPPARSAPAKPWRRHRPPRPTSGSCAGQSPLGGHPRGPAQAWRPWVISTIASPPGHRLPYCCSEVAIFAAGYGRHQAGSMRAGGHSAAVSCATLVEARRSGARGDGNRRSRRAGRRRRSRATACRGSRARRRRIPTAGNPTAAFRRRCG